ncbi:hypothetical protein DFJ74DRAFT_289772 [Hyaloraphidium curvatum]|nr:hypothetical protein DFJ74DRAFT_289772 [Hyaloraphidium curvatum]
MRPTPIPDSGSRTMPAASHARMRRTAVGGRGRLPRGAVAVCAALAAAVVLALLATAFPAVLGDAAPAIIDDAIDAADRVPAVRDPAAAAGALEPRQLGVKMTGRRSTTRRRKTTSRRRRSTTKKRRATSKRRSTSKRATSKRVTAKVLATTRPPVRTTTLPAIRTTRPVVVRTTVSPIPRVTPLPPTPFNLSVVADDRAAVLIFDNSTGGERNYRIVWGPANGSANVTAYWPHSNFQVQPLTPGVQYFATVQSVGTSRTLFGNLSLPAGPVFFSSNPARVDAIRAQATGFFDDFNTGPGDLDAGKWQTSYSRCADPAASATFINAQFHAHNLVKDLGFARGWCEGSHVAARPRGMFDFTGRTGKVFFDFDGPVSSNYWFLDFQKDEYFDNEAQMRQTMGYSVPSGNVTRYFLHMRQNLVSSSSPTATRPSTTPPTCAPSPRTCAGPSTSAAASSSPSRAPPSPSPPTSAPSSRPLGSTSPSSAPGWRSARTARATRGTTPPSPPCTGTTSGSTGPRRIRSRATSARGSSSMPRGSSFRPLAASPRCRWRARCRRGRCGGAGSCTGSSPTTARSRGARTTPSSSTARRCSPCSTGASGGLGGTSPTCTRTP